MRSGVEFSRWSSPNGLPQPQPERVNDKDIVYFLRVNYNNHNLCFAPSTVNLPWRGNFLKQPVTHNVPRGVKPSPSCHQLPLPSAYPVSASSDSIGPLSPTTPQPPSRAPRPLHTHLPSSAILCNQAYLSHRQIGAGVTLHPVRQPIPVYRARLPRHA